MRKMPVALDVLPRQSVREHGSRPQSLCVTIHLSPPDDFPRTGAWQWEADLNGPPDLSEVPL